MSSEALLFADPSSLSEEKSTAEVVRSRVRDYLLTALVEDDPPQLVRDSDRVDNYGEVFTPNWLVKQMMDHLPDDPIAELNKSALDPSCGNGQFLTEALRRKLATTAKNYAESLDQKQYQFDCLRSLSKIYGVDINADTAAEARTRMEAIVLKAYQAVNDSEPPYDFVLAVQCILRANIIVGDFLKENYTFIEWIPHHEHSFERKYWPAEVISSRNKQKGTLFDEICEPSKIIAPMHWRSIIGDKN
ncbi:MAG: N-6 DNA methylase [Bacteroidetes bacterium]|nr:N-6 DNA methylase [Bacteroidota bacterium]